MKRLFWFGLGVAVGALAVRQVSRAVRAYSATALGHSARDSMTNSAAGLWGTVQDFSGRAQRWVGDYVADVRDGMAEREEQIHEAFARGESLADLDAADAYGEDLNYLDDDDDDDDDDRRTR